MSIGSTKFFALGVGLLIAAGIAAVVLAKRHDQRLAIASALAVAAVQNQVSSLTGVSTGTARGIRIPFYEGDAKLPTSILLGRTAQPLEGGRYLVTEMRVESYSQSASGRKMEFVIEAPECLVDPAGKIASSPGRIVVSRTDGSFMTTGTGFEFRQFDSILNISNQVTTQLIREGRDDQKPTQP